MSGATAMSMLSWVDVCDLRTLPLDRGVCALVGGEQVALFRVSPDGELFAVSNYDPFSKAFVLSRGIVGSKGNAIKVASPVYKNGFCLRTGQSLDDPEIHLTTYAVRVVDGRVQVRSNPSERGLGQGRAARTHAPRLGRSQFQRSIH
jgi:nitrite reductase (NADH) small subunit